MISRKQLFAAGQAAQAPEALAKPACILLAEDDRSFRRYLEIFLKRAGYEVVSVADGLEALKVLMGQSSIDILVTDAIMPNLNGLELCRLVKNAPQLAQLPIVLLSALEAQEARGERRYVDAVLVKPVSNKELLSCLNNLLTRQALKKIS